MRRLRFPAALALLASALPQAAEAAERRPASVGAAARSSELEAQTRSRDMAAVQSYMTSIAKLAVLAKQKQNTALEAPLLFRIAESLYKVAAIRFRVAHSLAAAAGPGTEPDFKEYRAVLQQLVRISTRVIDRFPKNRDVPRAFYLRAQAHKELAQDTDAIRDFKHLIDAYPANADIVSAQMALFDVFVRNKDFRSAITYLKRLETATQEPYYPLVLDRLALAHYSLNEIPEALQYLELELGALPPAESSPGSYTEREKVLKNAALYYFAAVAGRRPEYTVEGAVQFFVRLKPGPLMGKVLGYFSNLLRSKGREDDLEVLRKAVAAAGMGGVEVAEVLFACLEVSANRQRFDRLKESADLLLAAAGQIGPGSKTVERMHAILSESAGNVQAIFLKSKPGSEQVLISDGLLALYQAMYKIATTAAARQKIDLNIAETYFTLKKHEIAVGYYRRVADAKVPGGESLAALARFRSVASGYEVLSQKGALPKEIAVKPMPGPESAAVPAESAQWIGWLDQYEASKGHEPVDSFLFEAGRIVYASGRVEDAVNRFKRMLAAYPASKHSVSVSSLILDTYLVSERWEDAHQLATQLLKSTPADPSKAAYRARLLEVAGDSYFKTAEALYKAADYEATIARAESFLKMYPTSAKKESCLALAGNSALALKDKARALTFLAPILANPASRPENKGVAILTRAALAEERWEFAAAASDYREYFKLPAEAWGFDAASLRALRSKALLWAWISGRSELLGAALGTHELCTAELAAECSKYTALRSFVDPARHAEPGFAKRAYEMTRKTSGPARSVWAVAALETPKAIGLNERNQLIEIVGAEWSKQDPLTQYALLAPVSSSITPALRQSGAELRALSKLQLEKSAIDRRTRLIAKLEAVVGKLLELPWARIRVAALGELAVVYADLARDLEALPSPEGLAAADLVAFRQTINELRAPFAKKAEELRSQALELATQSGVEGGVYADIAAAADPKAPVYRPPGPLLDVALFESLKFAVPLPEIAVSAVKERNWGLLAFVIREAQERKLMDDNELAAARGISLLVAGAQAESLPELQQGARELMGDRKILLMPALILSRFGVRDAAATKAAFEEFVDKSDKIARRSSIRPELAAAMAEAALWSKAEVSDRVREEIAALAGTGSRMPAQQQQQQQLVHPQKKAPTPPGKQKGRGK
jgi:tetratricopeptide (TPR) repeat protein